ncbi:MAG: hypothetical protein HY719_04005 [Planctomycetes bacterium]|nr:hypothetical protein [Planctomycetota bacterium]
MGTEARDAIRVLIPRLSSPEEQALALGAFEPGATLAVMEAVFQRLGGALFGGRALEETLAEKTKEACGSPAAPAAKCGKCGRVSRLKAVEGRELESTLGKLTYRRPVYRCRRCHRTFAPLDEALGVRAGSRMSPRLEEIAARYGIEQPFEKIPGLVGEFTGCHPAHASMRRAALHAGERAEAVLLEGVRKAKEMGTGEHAERGSGSGGTGTGTGKGAGEKRVLVVEVDGTTFATRTEWRRTKRGREGKKGLRLVPAAPVGRSGGACRRRKGGDGEGQGEVGEDGEASGGRATEYREAKVGVVYWMSERIEKGDRGRLLRAKRVVHVGHYEEFAWRVRAAAQEMGLTKGDAVVVLGDCSEWVDKVQGEFFPGATRIADFWHVCDHLAEAAREAYGEGSGKVKPWLRRMKALLGQSRVEAVCRAVKNLRPRPGLGEKRTEALRYLTNHAAKMCYQKYRARGLPVGSGAVEGGCKNLVGSRMKRAGAQWNEPCGDRLLKLKAAFENCEWNTVFPHSSLSDLKRPILSAVA